jgi:hypothetical protein
MTNIDELAKRVSDLVAEIDDTVAKAKHTYTFSHDDGGDEIDASDPSTDDTDAENSDDDEEDDYNTDLGKAATASAYDLAANSDTDRPGSLKHSSHPPNRHKFEALTDKIRNEEGIPKSEAMAQARMRFPDVYRSYQRHTNAVESTFKRAPTTFEDLVNAEMKKGVNREIAGQRVLQAHGSNALRNRAINKRAADIADTFGAVAEDIWGNSALDRCEALREARKARPLLFKALQAS